jgi:hypothetical protein
MPDKEGIVLSDNQLKSMQSVQSLLLKGILDVAKQGPLTAGAWDKVSGSWGRSSSIRNDLGDLIPIRDDINVILDTQALKKS